LPASLSKANDYTIKIEMEPFAEHPSSFEHPKISRKYFLEINAALRIEDDSIGFHKQSPVELLPDPVQSGGDSAAHSPSGPSRLREKTPAMTNRVEASPSRAGVSAETDQPPPAYDDALASRGKTIVRTEDG
jgi:hypothetical protein